MRVEFYKTSRESKVKIEVGSKWQHKDGGVYEVIQQVECRYFNDGFGVGIDCILYKDQQGEVYVIKEKHFLSNFKPCEPVYEYKFAFVSNLRTGELSISNKFYTDEKETGYEICQRLDFTKRERK